MEVAVGSRVDSSSRYNTVAEVVVALEVLM